MPNKRTFFLRQNTPLIHFHASQPGAFLRPSEVKPQLDRYLAARYQEDHNGANIPASWKVGYGNNNGEALNYKLNVRATNVQTYPLSKRDYPVFFADLGGGEDDRALRFTSEIIELDVQSFHPDLFAYVNRKVAGFFSGTNFMFRKTKGFGCFSVLQEGTNLALVRGRPLSFTVNCGPRGNPQSWKKIFEAINLFYKTIRGGINQKTWNRQLKKPDDVYYFKSLLFQYARREGTGHQWDKRHIRRSLFSRHPDFRRIENDRDDPEGTVHFNGGQPHLYRDILGLASDSKWGSYDGANVKKKALVAGIDRFASPLVFCPTFIRENDETCRVYLETRDIPAAYLGVNFSVESNRNFGRNTEISTPQEFSLQDYLNFVAHFFNNDAGNFDRQKFEDYVTVSNEQVAANDMALLANIYSQLSTQQIQ